MAASSDWKFEMRNVLGRGIGATGIRERVPTPLPDELLPGGATAGRWIKGVQLDLAERDVVVRETTKPLRRRNA